MIKRFPAPSGYQGYMIANAHTERGYFIFSLTLHLKNGRKTQRKEYGPVLEHCQATFPELLPLVELNGSDAENGVPHMVEENGWQWLAKAHGIKVPSNGLINPNSPHSTDTCIEQIAVMVRLPFEQVSRELLHVTTEKAWKAWVHKQKPRWRREAARGRKLLEKMSEPTIRTINVILPRTIGKRRSSIP